MMTIAIASTTPRTMPIIAPLQGTTSLFESRVSKLFSQFFRMLPSVIKTGLPATYIFPFPYILLHVFVPPLFGKNLTVNVNGTYSF